MAEGMVGISLWHLVWQSDAVSMGVLTILLIISILNWAVFITKVLLLFQHKRQCKKALQYLEALTYSEQLAPVRTQFQGTVPGYLLASHRAFAGKKDDVVEYTEHVIDQVVEKEQRSISLFTTSAAVAPLLGLFGTVWGLVHSFMSIAQTQAADIVAVAPGIAEALITTLAGLVVAIPALIMANYLQVQVRALEQYLILLADEVVRIHVYDMKEVYGTKNTTTAFTVSHD
ncbi:MAG TPA: MotA/TolQ/ExbB proton channel family protein [Candidatus Bathyarchaeia archaeon]|nr:MotA/TolQ/ExbB proton channel family protein [Candidatus Bathyarchaeia archaeon]